MNDTEPAKLRIFCVLGMSIDYRVKVPNSPAGGKS